MIELTINGKKVTAEEGSTILHAAMKNGIKIPNLCYDGRLRPYGACRLCVVEVEGQARLFASCSSPAEKGMVVKTDTPKLRKIRETLLELMLVHHPLDCPICDKAGECDLQDLAYEYGKEETRFIRHRKEAPPDVRGPLVELTSSRCILCGKCVRICSEHQGRGALGLIGRGFPTVVQPAFGEILECDYCGQCIDICPTGALLSKPYKFKARAWYLEEKDTICPFCGCGCTLTLGIREGMILRSRARESAGVSEGNLCGRGRFGFDYIYSENRLTTPLIRQNNDFKSVTWEEALNYIAKNLRVVQKAHGADAIGALGSPRCTNEGNYVLQKFMRDVIGSNNLDSSAATGYARVQKAWEKAFGQKSRGIDLRSPLGKEVILVVESDISVTHPVFGLNILKAYREGSRLIVADSRTTKLSRHSSQWLKIRSGTGVAFLNGLMNIIMDRGMYDRQKASGIEGFASLQKSLGGYTPDRVSGVTGVEEKDLVTAAGIFAGAKGRVIALSLGSAENTKNPDIVLAASNLLLLLGDGQDALQIPAEYANTYGVYQMGVCPDKGPGSASVTTPGKGALDMLYEPQSVRALYIVGEDPVVTFPDSMTVYARLKELDFLVVQDIAMTQTARLAHVVLPASSWAEKDGTFTNAEGRVQGIQRVVEPSGQSLPDWQIVRNLALTMGADLKTRNLPGVTEEIQQLMAEQAGEGKGTCRFNPVEHTLSAETDREYPFSLVVRDVLQHSGSISTRSGALNLVVSESLLEMNEEDARRSGIPDSSHVKVSSRTGTVYLKARVTDEVPEGEVFAAAHFPHAGIHKLTRVPHNGASSLISVRVELVK